MYLVQKSAALTPGLKLLPPQLDQSTAPPEGGAIAVSAGGVTAVASPFPVVPALPALPPELELLPPEPTAPELPPDVDPPPPPDPGVATWPPDPVVPALPEAPPLAPLGKPAVGDPPAPPLASPAAPPVRVVLVPRLTSVAPGAHAMTSDPVSTVMASQDIAPASDDVEERNTGEPFRAERFMEWREVLRARRQPSSLVHVLRQSEARARVWPPQRRRRDNHWR